MKFLVTLSILAVTVHCALSRPGNGGGPGRQGFGGGPSEWSGDSGYGGSLGGFPFGGIPFGGFPFGVSGVCSCPASNTSRYNPCRKATGAETVCCGYTNSYIQCAAANCSVSTCPESEIWNNTVAQCVSCTSISANLQISVNGTHCVCAQGYQPSGCDFAPSANSCTKCPINAVIAQYNCSCAAGSAVNYLATAGPTCQACPAGSVARYSGCQCTARQFWNAVAWACQDCPGDLITYGNGTHEIDVCSCTGGFFNSTDVTCVTCPAGSTASEGCCNCGGRNIMYHRPSNTCKCRQGYAPSSTGTGCTRVAAGTTTPASAAAGAAGK